MLALIVDEDRYEELTTQPQLDAVQHRPVTSPTDLVTHLREMVNAGYTDQQIQDLHPELNELFEKEDTEDSPDE